jgi:LCP family protein required for cell wall assembly
VPVVLLVLGWWLFGRIDRVEMDGALAAAGGGGTNYLIVGTDSRQGIDPDEPMAGAFLDGEFGGVRTDTIMVLRVGGGSSRLLSIPRDLWVRNAATGEPTRINATYQTSPATLVATVQESLGIPVHRYLEIGFPSFAGLVDSLGGITVDFPQPARDEMSGLLVEQAGPVVLDGSQALAYVRSRQYAELVDGTWRTDPTGDIGRTERQRVFLTTLFSSVGSTRNPLSLVRLGGALGDGMRIDDAMSYPDALRFAWQMRGLSPESVALPVYGRTTSGGAAVLELDVGAAEVLAGFGATAPPAPVG